MSPAPAGGGRRAARSVDVAYAALHAIAPALPAPRLPRWRTTYRYFAAWQQDGVFEEFTGLLRRLARAAEGRGGEPSACVLDSQTIKISADVRRKGQGTGAGKRIIGGKRHLGCDTPGLLLIVLVTAASVSDTAAGTTLLSRIAAAGHGGSAVRSDTVSAGRSDRRGRRRE
nr:transposase [Streptomyces sp. CB02923]